jgi:signal transduction histidine kinase
VSHLVRHKVVEWCSLRSIGKVLVAESADRHSAWPPADVGGPWERFAAIIKADRDEVLKSYASLFGSAHFPVAESYGRDQALVDAAGILSDLEASMYRGTDHVEHQQWQADAIGNGDQPSRVSPVDVQRTLGRLFDLAVASLADHVGDEPELLPCFATAVIALNHSIGRQLREVTHAYTGHLLERVDGAHAEERHRIARDLHDRLGGELSAALRQLELHEIRANGDALSPSPWASAAIDLLIEAMHTLRNVTSGLRQDSIRSLETALVQYVDSLSADADIRLRVSGDETWASPAVLEESYLILREAIRNALLHGSPRRVMIGVALAPHELHAWIEDDGCGFAVDKIDEQSSTGLGLSSVRERAGLIGGRLTIASVPGQGTQVELFVPLPAQRHE